MILIFTGGESSLEGSGAGELSVLLGSAIRLATTSVCALDRRQAFPT